MGSVAPVGRDGGAGQGLRVDAAADDRGHRNKETTVCVMHTSTRGPLPDMFRKTFAQMGAIVLSIDGE